MFLLCVCVCVGRGWNVSCSGKILFIFCHPLLWAMHINAVVAEWLRRWTWNPMGFPRAGSNPAGCENCLVLQYIDRCKITFVRCGVRTHAILRLWELKSHALDHSANLTCEIVVKNRISNPADIEDSNCTMCGHNLGRKLKKFATGRIRTCAPIGNLISSQTP